MTRSGKSRQIAIGSLDSFDDHCAGGSTEYLRFGEAVNMRVIPVEPGRLVSGNPKTVLKRWVARLNHGIQHVILVADRREPLARENAGSWK